MFAWLYKNELKIYLKEKFTTDQLGNLPAWSTFFLYFKEIGFEDKAGKGCISNKV